MPFHLHAPGWFGWQMLPGYTGERCVPYFSPVHVKRVQPLKTGKGLLDVSFFNAFYAEGVQDFQVRLKVLHRAPNFLVGKIVDEASERVAVISHIEFGWLREFCPKLIAAFPPESLGSPFNTSISIYLDGVFFQDPPLPPQPRSFDAGNENEWLMQCALRFDGYAFAHDHGLEPQPFYFCKKLLEENIPLDTTGHRMAAMFMLQRCLMKEGVRSKTDAGWKRFRELFLELADQSVPNRYQADDWHRDWEEKFVPILNAGKALIQHLHTSCVYDAPGRPKPR